MLALVTATLLLPIAALLIMDYRKTIRLRNQVVRFAIGTPENEIIASLGKPDSIGQGSRPDVETGEMVRGYTVWIYCSRFDWDGVRSRWNDASFIPYWFSRLSPIVDDDHDSVIELWIRNGKLDAIENAVDETLIGRHPLLSI